MIPSALLSSSFEQPHAAPGERAPIPMFRAIATVGAVVALQLAAFGLTWDILWHTYVGRDRFLTPPHVLLYFGVSAAGLLMLAAVLYETLRFRRGLRDPGTVPFLGFHASRGLYVAGFGVLTTAAAAPFDNLWHELYGIDVTIWSPFHMMGLFGSGITIVGLLYVLAQLANAVRGRARTFVGYNLYEWLAFLAFAGMCALTYVLAQPGVRIVPQLALGPLAFLPTPVICAFGMTLAVVAAVAFTGHRNAAAAVIGVYIVRQGVFNLLAPALILSTVAANGLAYRVPGFEPRVDVLIVVITLTLLPAVGTFLLAPAARATSLATGAIAGAFFALGTSAWVAAAQLFAAPLPTVAPPLDAAQLLAALVPTLILGALAGTAGTYVGRGFGHVLAAE